MRRALAALAPAVALGLAIMAPHAALADAAPDRNAPATVSHAVLKSLADESTRPVLMQTRSVHRPGARKDAGHRQVWA